MQERIAALTEANTELDAAAHEASAVARRADAGATRAAQERELLERHNAWLSEELTRKADFFQAERTAATRTVRAKFIVMTI